MDPSGMAWKLLITASVLLFSFPADFSRASSTISPGQSLTVNQTIVSEGGTFELGYFTQGSSRKYYIGIWYKKISVRTVVWVANRDEPISDVAASELKISTDGNLVLNQAGTQVWSSNITSPASGSTVAAVLLDTGNFVLVNASDSSSVLWESFDHPTDTWLPGQRLRLSRITGEPQLLVSWKSLEDPSSGLFAEGLDPNGTAQFVLWRNGTKYWSTGLWDGRAFANIPAMQSSRIMNFHYVKDEKENYFTYNFTDTSSISRSFMDVTGQVKVTKWLESSKEWLWVCLMPMNPCLPSSLCGAYGSCSAQTLPFCTCLEGFAPSNSRDWELDNWSGGCTRRTRLQCGNSSSSVNEAKDEFSVISNVKLPRYSEQLEAGSAEECASACLNSCSCTAYSYSNGCFVWQGDLYDVTQLSDTSHSSGADRGVLYLRLAASEFPGARKKKRPTTTKIVLGLAFGSLGLSILVALIICRWRGSPLLGSSDKFEGSLVSFKYKSLSKATNNFSDKLGGGGFGTVFRGTLPDSTAIAVKKLEKLGQGEKQFRAEVSTIGMIQHVNLVPLRGFCCEGSERLLVYDYMPNGSLADLLFRNDGSKVLDWETRYRVAIGIAMGLAYLHEECRDCIIHCDVKPDNILIDAEFSAKVTDFGMAKLVGREFSKVVTTIRGTLGYLAPEWVYGLPITEKADVYSYGMMLLEVVSGRRNTAVSDDGTIAFFPIFAAKMANEDDVVSLLDERLEGNADMDQLRRACRVALWCIQDEQCNRPTMGLVVQILEGLSDVNIPPVPKSFYNLE
ncbi:uncharacterized protein M6B38_368500 [Iris pallida]|uniref:Receptor-like serine/threonine-protein kinase n=1 Tax=Iris pallida TaxID=29817 RepID=A0AAX6GGF0_IRIPA|nr:uncharacterized protein M6B38_368500 [Iris pallida]